MSQKNLGFTIVELLIVIVVIGILATVSVIAFNGVKQKAIDTSLKTDATNAAKIVINDSTVNGVYPVSGGVANNGKGIPASNGNTYTYNANNTTSPPSYNIVYSNAATSNRYIVTQNIPTAALQTGSAPVVTYPITPVLLNTDGCSINYYDFYLSALATGSPTLTVQWQRMSPKNTVSGSWSSIPAGTTNPYTHVDTSLIEGDYRLFRAIFTSNGLFTMTSTIQLTLTNGC